MQDPTSTVFQQLNQPLQQQQQPPGGGGGIGAIGMGMVQFPEQEQLKCPRCESTNTKFCYYNNYNLSQPRHFCKSCRRYWTKGGALRNIPIGGGSRKNSSSSNKRSSSSSTTSSTTPPGTTASSTSSKRGNPDPTPDTARPSRRPAPEPASSAPAEGAAQRAVDSGSSGSGQDPSRVAGLENGGGGLSFSSLMSASGQFGSVFDGLGPNGAGHLGMDLATHVRGGGLVEDLNSGLGPGPNLRADAGGGGGGEEGYLQSGEWGSGSGWPDLAIYTPGSTSFH